MQRYILVIDEGTTSTRACLLSKDGHLVSQASESFEQFYPEPGWVEHDAEEIWIKVQKTIRDVLKKSQIKSQQIVGVGITNQRETVVAWDRESGKPLAKAIVWQCRRTTKICQKLKPQQKKIHRLTGLLLDPYFSASKMKWLLENSKEVQHAEKNNRLCFGTIDSYLIFRLTKGKNFATDASNASRTMLMDLSKLSWNKELLKIFKVRETSLPKILSSNANFGQITAIPELGTEINITGVLGDQQAALFGQAGFSVGDAKCTFGTGSFILFNTGVNKVYSKYRLLTTVAWKLEKQPVIYALEGGAFVCGAAVQWLRDGLEFMKKSSEVEQLALSVPDSQGVEFVPALTGLGAPHWVPTATGLMTGLTRGTTRAHVARATLESMALQNVDILVAMEKDLGRKLRNLRVDGGATANSLLLQIQSNLLQKEVVRPVELETTAFGVGLMAGLGCGLWKDLSSLKKLWKSQQTFQPELKKSKVEERIARWKRAIRAVKLLSDESSK